MNNLIIDKYKPKNLSDYYLDDNIKDLIRFFITSDNFNLLILGNICSGKTTFLNILINEYFNFNSELIKNNLLYINSLKDNGINYFRNDIKIFCQSNNIISKKKLIVIDDIDNINDQCQYLFLGLINKYKNKINFVITVNNHQKILDGFLSHLNIIKLYSPNEDYMYNFTKKILINEKININLNLINKIIKNSNNSIKNIVSIIEKFLLYNLPIDQHNIDFFLYHVNDNIFCDFTNYCIKGKFLEAIDIIRKIYDNGYSIIDIYEFYSNYIRSSNNFSDDIKFNIINILIEYIINYHNINENVLELYFFVNKIINSLNKNNINKN